MTRTDLDQRIFAEQLRLMEKQSFFIIAATLAVVLMSVGALWPFLPHNMLILWVALIGLLNIVRLGVLWCWHRNILQKHIAYYIISSGFSGLLWGGGGYFFLQQGTIEITIFVTLLVASAVVVGVASLSTLSIVYYAFSIPSMTGISLHFLALPGINKYIGGTAILYLIINMVFSREIQNILKRSIMLRFQNLDLINQLQLEKAEAISAREEAVKNSRAKKKFLAAASHDLRQPLNAMGFFIESLQQEQ
ncbi:MAG: hypothetical protein GXP02_07290, partial [Alphaproteobacteria bacterium]|nr:hypothetical protein [Alphaproteobacteria bacterium]